MKIEYSCDFKPKNFNKGLGLYLDYILWCYFGIAITKKESGDE